jgi:phosphoribosylformylglycinamidine synthase PurS subunit
MLTAQVFVRPKGGVLDPQGKTVQHALAALGFDEVRDVRVGRWIVLSLDGDDPAEAEGRVRTMCDRLLANGVIEDYDVQVRPAGS